MPTKFTANAPNLTYKRKMKIGTSIYSNKRKTLWEKYCCCFNCFKNVQKSVFCYYILLVFILHWKIYKILMQNQKNHNFEFAKNASSKREHVFIYSSFIYDKSQNDVHGNDSAKMKLVVLYLAEKSHSSMDDVQCIVRIENATEETKMETKKEHVHSLNICALHLFLITCTIDEGHKSDSYSITLPTDDDQQKQYDRPMVKLSPKRPSYEHRGLVLCMSRVFLFEKWQLLVTALEAYRMFKVDLVVAYVQSAILSVFKLLKAYEKLGFVKIMSGIRFPHHRGMPWDPNAETEFNGQILLAHECFYEYRESAEFIGLLDWDDLLVPSKHFSYLPAVFSAAFKHNPNTAYFLVNKLEASFVEQRVRSPARFRLSKMLGDGIRTAEIYNDEKMVVRPKAMRGFWMHNSNNVLTNKRAVHLFTNYSVLLHLANDTRVNSDEFQTQFLTKYNIKEMNRHASKQLKRLKNLKLPSSQPFYDALVSCHDQIFAFYKTVGPFRSGCLSYSLCVLPRLPNAICTVSKSKFHTVFANAAIFHVREKSEFVQERCIDESGL